MTTNKGVDLLLSCSADRNAYVWTHSKEQNIWNPQLVLLRFKRGAVGAKWNATGTQFAIGGVEGIVAIGYYEAENNWWVCKHLKKHFGGSPVQCLTWHPNGALLAVGLLDGNLHLVSAFLEMAQDKGANIENSWCSTGQDVFAFDNLILTVEVGSWIHEISFSPSGNALAWSTHSGHVGILYASSGSQSNLRVPMGNDNEILPLKNLLFLSEAVVLVTGYGPSLGLLAGSEKLGWSFKGKIDQLTKISISSMNQQSHSPRKSVSQTVRRLGSKSGDDLEVDTASGLASPHMATITGIDLFGRKEGKLATVGHDGRLAIWSSLGALVSQLELEASKI